MCNLIYLFISFSIYVLGVISKKSLVPFRSLIFFPVFAYKSFKFLTLTFRSIIHFEWFFFFFFASVALSVITSVKLTTIPLNTTSAQPSLYPVWIHSLHSGFQVLLFLHCFLFVLQLECFFFSWFTPKPANLCPATSSLQFNSFTEFLASYIIFFQNFPTDSIKIL